MKAYNTVRFRVLAGHEEEFERTFASLPRDFPGLRKISLIRVEAGRYFSVGEWESFEELASARPMMKDNLDRFRHTLEDHGAGKGITDAVSGEAIYESGPGRAKP